MKGCRFVGITLMVLLNTLKSGPKKHLVPCTCVTRQNVRCDCEEMM